MYIVATIDEPRQMGFFPLAGQHEMAAGSNCSA